jgi:integrase
MSDEIKVHVVRYGDSRNLMMRYRCPETGKQIAKTTGTTNEREALKQAAKWEDQLRTGRYQRPSRVAWNAFREYYSANALPALAKKTAEAYESTLNVFESVCHPDKLANLTTGRITFFVTQLRTDGKAEATIAKHLRQLKATARWANRQGLLNVLPQFNMPKRAKGAKLMHGRPITTEEFERMIEAAAKVVENVAAKSWEFYLRGLWESGLRLSESLTLRWDDAPESIVVDLSGRRPMLRIPAEAEKGHQDRLLPMTPEFAELLATVSAQERRGRVFKLMAADGQPLTSAACDISKIVTAIGKAAGVVVDERTKGDETVKKFASAHDLRRAFGQRWAARVMPTVLRELMRHTDISTTMKFYVGQNAEVTADALWAAAGNTLGNTRGARKGSGSEHRAK